MDRTYEGLEHLQKRSGNRKCDLNISDAIADFDRLRISALTKAAEISPYIHEVTIGPNCPDNETTKTIVPEETYDEPDGNADLLEDKIGEDLRYTLILKEYESKMKQISEETFNNLVEKMITERAEAIRTFGKKQSDECERKALELRARKIQLIKHLRENDNLSVLDKAKLDERNCQMINKQTIENMNRILEEQNKATARLASITDSHTKICVCYNSIIHLAQTEPQVKEILHKYIEPITTIIGNISNVMECCKTSSITDKEVKQAEILALYIENVKRKIVAELQKKQKEEEEEEARKKELEEQLAEEAKAAELAKPPTPPPESDKKVQPMFYSQKNYAHYVSLRDFLLEYESRFKELLVDPNHKKFRFDCQKAVNTPVNAISPVSAMHMKDKFDKLSVLLRGETVQVLDTFVTAAQHPQGLFYCTALLAKKIVRQGDLLVSSNPEAAFPLASVTVALCSQFPEFSKLLEANFHKECPYLVPMFLPQKEGQTDKEFYMARGYTYNAEGVVEKHDKFLKRMSGIFRLRCAFWIAKTPRYVNAPNPHGLNQAWQWLASFINLKPEPDICATLLHDFFTVCGSEFFKYYKHQFSKIIKLISTEYFAILADIDEGGPKTRLEVFLQNVLKTGQIAPPSGLSSSSF
ncbi:uncharacterized protein Gle1 [Epargyreus clarus]|uniref:uncharacterized protein Gle1 n=1 Tax=Epargyreus clarus TaxID=520877 RepID=UPI003C2BA7C8